MELHYREHDLIGLFDRFTPKFVKQYATIHEDMARAFAKYKTDVEYRVFPEDGHTIEMNEDEWAAFLEEIDQ